MLPRHVARRLWDLADDTLELDGAACFVKFVYRSNASLVDDLHFGHCCRFEVGKWGEREAMWKSLFNSNTTRFHSLTVGWADEGGTNWVTRRGLLITVWVGMHRLTYNDQINNKHQRWVGGYLTLVQALISFICILDQKLPIIRCLMLQRVARVAAVRVTAYCD